MIRVFQFLAIGLVAFVCGCRAGGDSSSVDLMDSGASATLTWNDAPSAQGYRIHYGVTPGNYDAIINVGPNNSYVISGLHRQTTYYFAVTAYNGGGESGYSNEVSFVSR